MLRGHLQLQGSASTSLWSEQHASMIHRSSLTRRGDTTVSRPHEPLLRNALQASVFWHHKATLVFCTRNMSFAYVEMDPSMPSPWSACCCFA